jgi:hypothetical protein
LYSNPYSAARGAEIILPVRIPKPSRARENFRGKTRGLYPTGVWIDQATDAEMRRNPTDPISCREKFVGIISKQAQTLLIENFHVNGLLKNLDRGDWGWLGEIRAETRETRTDFLLSSTSQDWPHSNLVGILCNQFTCVSIGAIYHPCWFACHVVFGGVPVVL